MGDDANGGSMFVGNLSYSFEDFMSANIPTLTKADLATLQQLYTHDNVPDLLFPNGTDSMNDTFGPDYNQIAKALGDLAFTIPGLYVTDAYANLSVPSYNYLYNATDAYGPSKGLGVYHAQEVGAILGNGSAPGTVNQSQIVTAEMTSYWASFVRTLDPNIFREEGSVAWERWTPQCQERLVIGNQQSEMQPLSELDRERYDAVVVIGAEAGQ